MAIGSTAAVVVGDRFALATEADLDVSPDAAQSPFRDMFPAVIDEVGPSGLTVTSGRDGSRLHLAPHGFDEWPHLAGDKVTVVEDHDGVRTVRPLVETSRGTPRRHVRIGTRIPVDRGVAVVTTEAVKTAMERQAARGVSSSEWLLISNSRSGDRRIFGILEHA